MRRTCRLRRSWQSTPRVSDGPWFGVTYRYTPSKSKISRTRQVPGSEFVRGFAQHTLPSGFQKIRHYGWMSSNSRLKLDEVKWLVWLSLGWTFWLASGHAPQQPKVERPVLCCAECGGVMRVIDVTYQPRFTLSDHALAYLDSG